MDFIINYSVPGRVVIKADNEEQAIEKFYNLSETKISDSCGFDAATIDSID